MFLIYSPLEQFAINRLVPLCLGGFDFSITNSTILVILSCSLGFLFFNFSLFKAKLIPSA
jgi:hypothetical protein